jgi:hypothetical protein
VPGAAAPPPDAAVFTELKAEDKVRVTLRNGNTAEFVLADVQPDALTARDGRRFPYADIARLERIRVSEVKTVVLIGSFIGIVILLEMAAEISRLSHLSFR